MRISHADLARHFRVLVVGGGAGGMGISHKLARKLPRGSVAIIDPSEKHYYQPGWTLVGGGLMSLSANTRQQSQLIHPATQWIQQAVEKFEPAKDTVRLRDGEEITYDYMVVATGVQPRFDKIEGLVEALDTPGVCSNYSPVYCEKTYRELRKFESGTCLFTFPSGPIKCAGAPQKICYLADEILRQRGKRDAAKLIYATALPKVFGVEKYAKELDKVLQQRDIQLMTNVNLVKVDASRRVATLELLSGATPTGETKEIPYSFLHVGPPCSPIQPLIHCQPLTDHNGFIDVNPETLQSKAFPNVFGVGDCMNTPNAKTAAAVSSHLKTLERNLDEVMRGRTPTAKYDGYASCPLVVSSSKAILAEFNQDGPMETMPIDQSKPRRLQYLMKRHLMPFLYWFGLIRGHWNGPATIRKMMHLGFVPKQK